ncbi:haloacid dehalogenase-like hydrolase family member protein [Theileria equi strain WA]|uniref:Haloacid dehalogenase-like hydrolase family member protein n=1 Tax=Theileria equi strain WA TaxID=1537102 RepID=L1LAP0_THEEQ|nr:haloacid dehalogenase-like hydrolase family member protein [Theileria equi strain WA]EKX72345.1 haloacid dehalogenase-like hydrolase family member protein [Theileria equi strain WA]|eukprot:XP_004831797.1 haloacid dehalogenase-like hydrolase family member protein [Theileria equi strain WA]
MEICDTHSPMANLSQFLKPEELPKYFGIDVDGTLYTKNVEGFERNVKAITQIRKRGYIPFICTGRSRKTSFNLFGPDFVEKTGYRGYPGVYKNGAVVYDEKGDILSLCAFSEDFLTKFSNFLTENKCADKVIFFTEDYEHSLADVCPEWRENLISINRNIPKTLTFEELLKKNVVMIKYAYFKLDLPDLKEGIDYIERADQDHTRDLCPPGVTKASALSTLINHYGLSPKDCGFIGDCYNDVECLRICSPSFAVANAKDVAKRSAQWVLDKTCDQGAVAEALQLTYGPL